MNKGKSETIKVFLVLLIIISVVIIGFFLYKRGELTYYNEDAYINQIADKKWFSVPNRDVYEMIEFTNKRAINYIYYDRIDNVGTFSGCDAYIYSFKKELFKVLCENNKEIKVEILEYDDDRLVLLVNKNKHIYYSSLEQAMK